MTSVQYVKTSEYIYVPSVYVYCCAVYTITMTDNYYYSNTCTKRNITTNSNLTCYSIDSCLGSVGHAFGLWQYKPHGQYRAYHLLGDTHSLWSNTKITDDAPGCLLLQHTYTWYTYIYCFPPCSLA